MIWTNASVYLGRYFALATAILFVGEVTAGDVITGQRLGADAAVPGMGYSVYITEGEHTVGLPVVYMLHGFGASDAEWLKSGTLAEVLDALIASGRVPPMIAVMPDADKSWYVDSASRGGPGDYETAIVSDLVREIDARFPTEPSRESRALAGISMGGFGALRMGLKHPDVFGAVAALSAGLFKPEGISRQHGPEGARRDTRDRWYGGVFGNPFDAEIYNRESPFAYVKTAVSAPVPPEVLLIVGDDDYFGSYDGTVELFLDLRAAGLKPELRVLDGGHNWDFWRPMIDEVAFFLADCWSRSRNHRTINSGKVRSAVAADDISPSYGG